MRQLSLAIVFTLILSITSPALAISKSQQRLSIPEISLIEFFKEILAVLTPDIRSPAKNDTSSDSSTEPHTTQDSEEAPTDPAGDDSDETDEPTDPAWGPYTEPNG